MNSELVSEYNFSNGVECDRDTNVENWWNVRLTNGTVVGQNWTDELTVSKLALYRQYVNECIGDDRGVVFFWGNLTRLVPFVSQTSTTVTLPLPVNMPLNTGDFAEIRRHPRTSRSNTARILYTMFW